MRILQVAHNLVHGDGQGRINLEIARRAADLGHQVVLIADAIDPILLRDGIECHVVRPVLRQPNLLKVWRFAQMANEIIRRLRQPGDVVIGNGFTLTEPHDLNLCQFVHAEWACSPVHVSRLRSGPYAWYQWQYTSRNTRWEAKAFGAARWVVAPSEKIVGDLTRSGVAADKVRVIYNGVDPNEFQPGQADRRELGLSQNGVLALFAGDIRTPRKNLDSVLKALVRVRGLELAVVGDVTQSPFPALARKLGVEGRVKFMGYRRDVGRIMQACDFFVFPSRYEAGALVILEALSAGLPVISARSAGGAELVGREAGVVLDDSEDIAALAAAMNQLTEDAGLREKQGIAARQIAEQHTWTRMADEYLQLLGGGQMKLLVVSHSCVTAVNQQLYAEVAKQTGWQVDLIIPSNWRDEYGRDCAVTRWPAFTGELIGVPVWKSGNIILHSYRCNFARLLRKIDPDVIYVNHEPYAVATAQVYAANRLANRKPIGFYSCQNIFKRYPIPFRWAEAAVLKTSKFAFPISQSVDDVFRRKGFAGPATVLPLAVDERTYFPREDSAAVRQQFATTNQPLLGYVGRLVKEKGLLTLVDALQQIKALDWRFVMVGTGPLADELRRRVQAAGLGDRVHFAGFVPHEQTPALLSALDWLVLPSETQANWREQFGRVIIEAMACGTAVIGSDSGEIPTLIQTTGGGLVFAEGNSAELAQTIRHAILNPGLAESLAAVGRAVAVERFGTGNVVSAMVRTIEFVCSEGSPSCDPGPLVSQAN